MLNFVKGLRWVVVLVVHPAEIRIGILKLLLLFFNFFPQDIGEIILRSFVNGILALLSIYCIVRFYLACLIISSEDFRML